MKKLIKIGALSLALIASLLLLSNTTNALTGDSGPVSLKINTGASTCVYGTSLQFTAHTANFLAFNETGTFSPSAWSCTDYMGLASWVLSLSSSDLTNATSQSIASGNVKVDADVNTVTAGACTAGSNTSTWTPINIAKNILQKTSAAGQICTITANGVQLSIAVPANQAIGLYTGTLTVTLPIGF